MENLIGTWGASYLVHIYSLGAGEASKWVSLYFGGIMIGRFISGFIALKCSDNTLVRLGVAVSFLGIIFMMLPIGRTAICGLLLVGIGFGPIFPSILHTVPARFGKEYSADITGFHMFGAYAVGFLIQLIFGYVATATTFAITPYVLVALAVVLTEIDDQGGEHPRGMKTLTVPAHQYPTCRDVLVKCIKFVLPEDLDVSGGSPTAMCNLRNFRVRVFANNIDSDFQCCDVTI